MEIVKYTNHQADAWDDFVSKSKNGIFLFKRNYLDYHKDRFSDHSLFILKNQKIVALFPANQEGIEICSHAGLTFGSLVMGYELKATEVIEIFDNIKKYYSDLGFKNLIYKAIPSIFHNYPSEEDLYALFRIDAKLIRRDISSVIEIKKRIRFSESKKQSVAKCKSLDITISENKNFAEYWDILTEVLNKFGTKPVHSLEEISKLHLLFPENIRLFEARKEKQLLAGIVIYDFGKVAHTQYMANSTEGRNIGALDFLNYDLIENIFAEKEYFSFGISTTAQGKILNEGLIQQKEMMGSRGIAVDFYKIEL